MRLEDLTVTLRPRQPWEAVDLGCSLVRRDYGHILLLWLITVVPLWAVLALLLRNDPIIFFTVVRWLKPLYDCVPLFYLSRAAFGSKPTIKETLKAWPGLWLRFLLPSLIFRRISLIRSFALPIWMLEGQKGKAITQRVKALTTVRDTGGAKCTLVFFQLELAVILGLFLLTSSVRPDFSHFDLLDLLFNLAEFIKNNEDLLWYYNLLQIGAITLIEPFYVGAGFGLYLNARTHLEGWDVELTFRRLAQRLRSATAVVLLSFGFIFAHNTYAQSSPDTGNKVSEALGEIYAQPEFKEQVKTIPRWVSDEIPEKRNASDWNIPTWVRDVLTIFGYACLAFALFWLGRWVYQNRHLFKWKGTGQSMDTAITGPRVIMGLDIARESLPDDIIAAARAAWIRGDHHEALSLIYRGSLSRLVEKRLPIHDSDTEDDCLIKVAQLGNDTFTQFFRQLTLVWIRAAYASETPRESEFHQLCQTWPFDQNPVTPTKKQRSLAAAAVLLLILPWLASCGKGHWEDETINLGYKGEARINPFLATQQLLEKFGHDCERKGSLKKLPNHYESVIFVSAETGISKHQADQLLQWASNGGHVVYLLSGSGSYNDWGFMSSLSVLNYAGSEEPDPVLEELDVQITGLKDLFNDKKKLRRKLRGEQVEPEEDTPTTEEKKDEKADAEEEEEEKSPLKAEDINVQQDEIRLKSQTYQVDFPSFIKLTIKRPLRMGEYQSGSRDTTSMFSLKRGLGRVSLVAHARPLRNRYLDEKDHASWLLALVGEPPQSVYFFTSAQKGFMDLLWERAWMPLIGLGLVTLIWLWINIPRFGPLKRVELHETKHFVEHIGALGQFFYRMDRPDILLNAAADAVRIRAFKKHPHLINQDNESLVKVLTDLSPLPPAQIVTALEPARGKMPSQELARRLDDLKTLRECLA